MTIGSRPTPEPPLDASIGDWLRWALPRHGYDPNERGTNARLAEATGVPAATISRLLRNAGQPDMRTLLAVAQALGEPVLPMLVRARLLPPRYCRPRRSRAPSQKLKHSKPSAPPTRPTKPQCSACSALSMPRGHHLGRPDRVCSYRLPDRLILGHAPSGGPHHPPHQHCHV